MWWCNVLAQIYKETLAQHRYVVGKRRSFLMAFSDECRYDSLTLHWKIDNK